MPPLSRGQEIHYVLRLASAMCFIGHGAFGIITKPIWCDYFAVFGIDHNTSYLLMPVLGVVDILLGLSLLLFPTRAVVLWLVIWGLTTAILRPVSGEPFAELIERAGNYSAPLALLILNGTGRRTQEGWFTRIEPVRQIDNSAKTLIILCLRISVFLLLVGHGWLNLIEKKGLLAQYVSLGFSNQAATARIVGLLEILAAFMVLIRPVSSVLLIFLIWKMTSELFYPHWEIFEWVERGGSYGVILALWIALKIKNSPANKKRLLFEFDILHVN
jgi:uncharacterized membrane protein YphA (DoxX/SURF4 family)